MAEEVLQLDLKEILKKRIPADKRRWIPGFVVSWLERLIRQKELNEILRVTYPGEGSDFADRVLKHLDIRVDVEGLENLKEGERYMFASNHPLGGLDGIALIKVLGEKYGDEGIRFLVNDMLMNVTPLKGVFLPVNKFGRQGRDYAKIINEKINSDCQILQFPAGLCSRLHDNGEISDMEWQKSFVVKALDSQRDIVPVYFEGRNSKKFYKIARWRKKLGLKFNLEQVLLPSELCKSRGSHYRIVFGKPVSWNNLQNCGKNHREIAAEMRSRAYALA